MVEVLAARAEHTGGWGAPLNQERTRLGVGPAKVFLSHVQAEHPNEVFAAMGFIRKVQFTYNLNVS